VQRRDPVISRETITRRVLLCALGGAAATVAWPAVAQRTWTTYRNERFGTTIDYPSDKFTSTDPPANADGPRFVAADGGRFTVSAINNVLHQRLAAIETAAVKGLGRGARIASRERAATRSSISVTSCRTDARSSTISRSAIRPSCAAAMTRS
jgi:hypothetical protein